MKTVTLNYFAALREARGQSSETIETGSDTLLDLYEELRARHAFPLPASALQVAVNDDFAEWDRRVEEGDRVVFIAPVAGG
ncbi:MAG: MoaD/ThiS family protein [Gemmatimonadota bacterium]